MQEDSRLSKSTAEQPVPSSPASSHDSPDAPPSAAADDSSEEVLATSGIQQLFQPPTDLPELKQAHKYTYYGRSYDLSFVSNYCFEAVYNSEIRLCYRVGTCFSLPQSAGLWVLGAITGRNANNPAASAVCGVFYEVETGDTATANISWLGVKHIRRMASPEERARCQAAMKALTRIPKPIRTATPRPRTLNLADQRISVYRQKARAGPAMQPSKRPKKKHRSDFVHWKAKYRSEAAASADQVSDDASHDEEDSAMESEQEEEEVEFEFFDARAVSVSLLSFIIIVSNPLYVIVAASVYCSQMASFFFFSLSRLRSLIPLRAGLLRTRDPSSVRLRRRT